MKRVKFFPTYQTSKIHISELIYLNLFNDEDASSTIEDDETAYLVANHEDDGSWSISSRMPWGDENVVREDLSLEQMMRNLLCAEAANNPLLDIDETTVDMFLPHISDWLPDENSMKQMNTYIHSQSLPRNHICRLAHAIGQDKIFADNIFTSLAERGNENHLLPHSQKGPNGSKINLN